VLIEKHRAYRQLYMHRTGHSAGLECPRMSELFALATSAAPLEAGHVLTVVARSCMSSDTASIPERPNQALIPPEKGMHPHRKDSMSESVTAGGHEVAF